MSRILIVDDEIAISELIADALIDEGFDTVIKNNGKEALKLIEDGENFDLIMLDIMMPQMDGYELCRKIRDKITCPIVFLTAKNRTIDTLLGLELGADDYITKPFVVEEVVARVKSHIRRENRYKNIEHNSAELNFGDIKIFKDRYEAYKDGKLLNLSTREFELLTYLIENKEKVLTKEQLFDNVWGLDYGDIGTVAVNIKNLRDKVDPKNEYIKTIWGLGYKIVNPKEK